MPLQANFKDAEDKMQRVLATLTRELTEIRGGRATPSLVEHVTVEYYGAAAPLKQVAAISAPEARLLVIQPWDATMVPAIEKAIQQSGLGVSPVVDGKLVRLPIPSLTGERREQLVKLVHKIAEDARVHVRNVRRDANEAVKKLKAEKQLAEDDAFKAQERVQHLTDRSIKRIDELVAAKEHELHSA